MTAAASVAGFVWDPRLAAHVYRADHPLKPRRLRGVHDTLERLGAFSHPNARLLAPRDATRAELERDPLPLPRITLDPALRTLDEVSGRYREILEGARRGDKPAGLLDGFARLEGYRHHEAIPAKMAV